MAINLKITDIRVKGGLNPVLDFSFETESWFGGPSYLVGIEGQLLYNNFVISDKVSFNSYQLRNEAFFGLHEDHTSFNFRGNLETPISNQSIKYIENIRSKSDLQFTFRLVYRWQKILDGQTFNAQNFRDGKFHVGPIRWAETTPYFNVARSTWIELLKQLHYSEIELFEIQKPKLIEKEIWDESLRFLTDAQNALRTGDFEGTLTKCRQSLECLAKHYSPDDVKQGFEILFTKVFSDDDRKRVPINSLMLNLSEFSHFGRHGNNPPVFINKEEAEFIYISTLNLISFVSQCLSKNKA